MTTPLAPAPQPSGIRTPDQRLRVFVSSTLRELAPERQAVRSTIQQLRLTPVMFETGARPHPPRDLYRAYLDQSDVFLGIYWQSYGWVAPGEDVSGLEDEYLLSGDRPKLIYVKAGGEREPALKELLDRIRNDDRAAYKAFADADELSELVADDVAVLLTERFTRPVVNAPSGLRRSNLPVAVTPIIGRASELATLTALLADPDTRLVTVIGPGGIGKTRLVLEVASTISAALRDSIEGVWFVDLTPVHDPRRVLELIAASLGVRSEGTRPMLDLLINRLQDRAVLLVLDNFEQLLDAGADLGELLAACPRLTLLVTSRAALGLRGEREVTLAPLGYPVLASATTDQVASSPAVQLLLARGRQVRPGLSVTEGNAAAIGELCRRLDGIPLALELAAAQLRILSPAQLLARLTDRLDRTLDLDAGLNNLPTRQRTLRTTVEWSHSLLDEDERAVLARLSVFAQSWSLTGAEVVGAVAGDVNVFDVLTSLVSHSLVSVDERDPDHLRFRMLGMVRAFAMEQLDERGEYDPTLDRLTDYLRTFAAEAGTALRSPANRDWGVAVDNELDDLMSTLQRAVHRDDAETIIRLSAPLFTYWWSRGMLKTMQRFATLAAELPSAAKLPPDAVALLDWARGMFLVSTGRVDEARPVMTALLAEAPVDADRRLRAFALAGLALTLVQTDGPQASRLLDEAADDFRSLDDKWGLAFSLSARGQLALQNGEPATATAIHTEALNAARDIANDHLQAQLLYLLGLDALVAGDVTGARAEYASAVELHLELLDQEGSAYCLEGLARIALAQGHPETAARLLGASAHTRESVGVSVWPGVQASVDALHAEVASALDPSAFRSARATGALMQTNEALTFALESTSVGGAQPGIGVQSP